MKYQRAISLFITAFSLWSGLSGGHVNAEGVEKQKKKPIVIKAASDRKTAAGEAFRKDFPNARFTNVEESGIEGLYEISTGVNIVFYAPAAGRIIFGEMLDKAGKNITAEKRKPLIAQYEAEALKKEAATAKLIDSLPLDKAIKVGTGRNIVIEFTDIDCPYCRKVEEFFKNREDITRYIFLFPLDQIHPKSAAKSREVLCSKEPSKAYIKAMEGELDKSDVKGCGGKEEEVGQILAEYRQWGERMGVSGTPMLWVNKRQIQGADIQKLESYLVSASTGTR